MLLGTLKETLIFQHQDDSLLYRYEIFKNERHGGYFSIVYVSDVNTHENKKSTSWVMVIPFIILKSNYLPNARIECDAHFNEIKKTAVMQ